MKAIPVSFEVTVNFECNGCGEILSLHNREVPSIIGKKARCGGCKKWIDVPAMVMDIDELQGKPKVQEDNGNKDDVVKVLKNYGYSPNEIKDMISVITDFNQDTSVLLKIALASKEE
jgi:hypothetical protein